MLDGVHITWLAQIAPGTAALACLAITYLMVWLVFFGIRPVWYLVLGTGYLFWCIYFSLLFISAGPHPLLARADIAVSIRDAELLGAIAMLVWAGLMLRRTVTVL